MSRRSAPALALVLLLAPSDPGTGAEAAATGPPELLPVPHPALERMENGVQERLRAERQALDRYLKQESTEPETLGLAFAAMGQLYQVYNLSRPAVACFENARRLLPADYRWPYHLGVLHQLGGELDEARDRLTEAASLAPRDLPTRIRLGQVLTDLDDLDGAEEAFREVLAADPESAAAHYGLGRVLYAHGDFEEAIEHLETALNLQPEADSIHHLLGMAYRRSGDLEQARTHLALNRHTPVSFSDPLLEGLAPLVRSGHRHFKAGTDALGRKDFEAAAAHFRNSLSVDPENALTHYNLALALLPLGRDEEAEAELRRSLELDPGYVHAHYNLGVLLTEDGRFKEAAWHFEKAHEFDPNDPEACLEWAAALGRLGRFAEAAAAYEQAVQLTPGNPDVWFGRAMALILAAQYAAAQTALEEGIEAVPDNTPLTHLLARLLATSPDPEVRDGQRAHQLATLAFEQHPSLDHAETVAMALAELGRFDEAVEWQRRVIAEAETARDMETARHSRQRLSQYRERKPIRAPWHQGN